ncbi:ABC transporter permease subunit [Streptomyces sp. NPDC059003]|uniref:ABC transporter permease subunit n=1 Tax=Streptomyces sp. NPDC059003 TaxID=3346691 RepID=UPI0036BD2A5E
MLALPVGCSRPATGAGRPSCSNALPGITVALSLVFLSVRYARPLYQERPLLVGAYAVLFLPVAVAATRAAVLQAPPGPEDVARSLGRGPWRVLREVTVPLAAPGAAAGAALILLAAIPSCLLGRQRT